MAFSRTLVLLMALMALVVSSVNAAPPSSRFCGKCLLDDSRIDTIRAKKAFRFTDVQKEDFCFAEFGAFSPGLVYEVIRGPNSNGRCKVACRYVRLAHFSLRRFGSLQTEELASTFADAKR